MKVYKCDGSRYKDNVKCKNEVNYDLPEWWLTIRGHIKNGLADARIIESNTELHFCSRTCMEFFFFKQEDKH